MNIRWGKSEQKYFWRSIRISLFFLSLFIVFNFNKASAETLGISPPIIDAKGVLNNANLEATINLTIPTNAQEELSYKVVFRGDYANFLQGSEEVIIPAGKNSASYTFIISPASAANGDYECYIDFLRQPGASEKKEGATVAVTTGATGIIKIAITDKQLLEYQVSDLQALDTEIEQPFIFNYVVNNTGNTQWKPDKIELTINEEKDASNTTVLTVNEGIPLSNAGSNKKYDISTDHQLVQGKYLANATFYYQNTKAAELVSQLFQVFSAGTLQQKGEFISLVTNKQQFLPGEKIKVEANFRNTGDIALKGILVTELYSADNSLIDLRRSTETEIMRGEEAAFTEYYQLDKVGAHTVNGYIEYGNKKTEKKIVQIQIMKEKGFINANIIAYAVLIFVTIIIFLFVFLFKRRKTKNGKEKK